MQERTFAVTGRVPLVDGSQILTLVHQGSFDPPIELAISQNGNEKKWVTPTMKAARVSSISFGLDGVETVIVMC